MDVFTEAEAFAWAAREQHFQNVRFAAVTAAGPDIHSPGHAWIEAKRIRYSREELKALDEEAQRSERDGIGVGRVGFLRQPNDRFLHKFEDKLDIAIRQFGKVPPEKRLIIYFRVSLDSLIGARHARAAMEDCLVRRGLPQDVEVVAFHGDPWRHVVIDWPKFLRPPNAAPPAGYFR